MRVSVNRIPRSVWRVLWIGSLVVAFEWVVLMGQGTADLLDSTGGSSSSANYCLVAGSLGQPIETGTAISDGLRLGVGFLNQRLILRVRLTGDFNGDDAVDFSDFLLFASAFGRSQGEVGFDVRFDLDGNGAVSFPDFLVFAGQFGN